MIEKLIRSAYVERKGKQLRSTEQGRNLINVVALRLKDVALTAEMEQVLSDVEHGNADPTQTESRFRHSPPVSPPTRSPRQSPSSCKRGEAA